MMTGQLIGQLILWLIVAVIVIAIIYWVMNWLYRRSTKEMAFVLKNTNHCHGFYGASSMERLPTEIALTEQTRKFKQIGR